MLENSTHGTLALCSSAVLITSELSQRLHAFHSPYICFCLHLIMVSKSTREGKTTVTVSGSQGYLDLHPHFFMCVYLNIFPTEFHPFDLAVFSLTL